MDINFIIHSIRQEFLYRKTGVQIQEFRASYTCVLPVERYDCVPSVVHVGRREHV